MKNILFLIGFLLLIHITFAQKKMTNDTLSKSRIELETDPIAFALNGYSFHIVYVKNRLRYDLGVFGANQPEEYSGNKGFQTYSQGLGGKINYLINKKETWFAGIGAGYAKHRISSKTSEGTKHQETFSVGIHTGYRFFLFKNTFLSNMFIAPWASLDYNIPLNKVSFRASDYKTKSWSIFPTIHIGYKF